METFFGDIKENTYLSPEKVDRVKDWNGCKESVYKILGASNHSVDNRAELDYYATDPLAVKALLYLDKPNNPVWEPACGEGHISKTLESYGYDVLSTDLWYRGFGKGGVNFLEVENNNFWDGDIITNPPYKYATEFCYKALEVVKEKRNVYMFLKLTFLESSKRYKFFRLYPPVCVYVSVRRLLCAKNGKFAPIVNGKRIPKKGYISSSAVAYCWFKWTKGFTGDTIIKWFDVHTINS